MQILDRFTKGGLAGRSLRASGLTFGAFFLQRFLQLGSNLILTRMLVPEAFGLMALINVFFFGLQLITDVGIAPSVIRSTRRDESFLATAWSLQILRSIGIALVAVLLAKPYAVFYDSELLFPIILLCTSSTIIHGFTSIEVLVLSRELHLKKVILWEILVQCITVLGTIFFVWYLQSVWGLAAGIVIGGVSHSVLSLRMFPSPANRFCLEREAVSEIFHFGKWILIGTMFTFAAGRGLQMIWGSLVPLEALGFLYVATMYGWAIGELLTKLIGKVAFPALSEVVRERPDDIGRVMHKMKRFQLVLSLPAFVVLAFLAHPLIALLYDDRYREVGDYLEIFALNGAIASLPMLYQNTFLAMGESRLHSFVMAISAVLRCGGTVAGFFIAGPIGMIVGVGMATVVVYAISAFISYRRGYFDLQQDAFALGVIAIAYSIILAG